MVLIKSISGIRGTIGGVPGDSLTPLDVVNFSTAYAKFIRKRNKAKANEKITIVVGRDGRVSGDMVNRLVTGTLLGCGADVIDLELSTTPTVEMAVVKHAADGGIIITASHNPTEWNALKMLNEKGEFLSADDGAEILESIDKGDFDFSTVNNIGSYSKNDTAIIEHIEEIKKLDLVDCDAIKKADFKVAIDCVNSTGGIAIPALLKAIGVERIVELYCEPNGHFPHNPEPIPENLNVISETVVTEKADVGFVVDPDVDRLAIVSEDGEMFGEEYTLVSISDYILKHSKGNTVSNLSSTRALRDVTEKAGGKYFASAVGEVNVVEMMKEQNAVIGGEGNGGIIYPELHYGRDALVGIALFLTQLAKKNIKCSSLRSSYPNYIISKNKINLPEDYDVDEILKKIAEKYKNHDINTIDGVKIDFENEWIHLRKSNTEPIVRIYSESDSEAKADHLARKLIEDIKDVIKQR